MQNRKLVPTQTTMATAFSRLAAKIENGELSESQRRSIEVGQQMANAQASYNAPRVTAHALKRRQDLEKIRELAKQKRGHQ